jgi:hypothetical protein
VTLTEQLTAAAILVSAVIGAEVRYAPMAGLKDLQWTIEKRDIRELKGKLLDDSLTPRERAFYEEELEQLLDEFCYKYPDDRECKGHGS